ncbi:hypothetical protein PR002_g896 [Phytophthora rubi]|uniref:Uncharacterized protein n=1 Tax=Phytophthora rubi TaxID=129364 RepID=A0A6A3P555_9STRA|nr:hypothetical protein PR002_g896 [Phytophthora rubi]
MISKADRKGAFMNMSLCTKYVDAKATFCASSLAYREDMCLNISCTIVGMAISPAWIPRRWQSLYNNKNRLTNY